MMIFFFVCIIEIVNNLVLSVKTEIRFNLIDVPTLFRCQRNGLILRFDHFPTENQFHDVIKNGCDLSLATIQNRIVLEVQKIELHCFLKKTQFKDQVNELLIFTSKCPSLDLCIRSMPPLVTIITEYKTRPNNPTQFDLAVHGIGTNTITIGGHRENSYSWKDDVYNKGGFRTNQIVFKYEQNKILNMMCEYTYVSNPEMAKGVCRRHYVLIRNSIEVRKGQLSSSGTGFSWICYYYPSGAEEPMDYKMIKRAIEDFERNNPSAPRYMALPASMDVKELTENSSSLDAPNDQLSNSTASVLLFLFVIGAVGVVYCIYKKQAKKELSIKLSTASDAARSSVESNGSNLEIDD